MFRIKTAFWMMRTTFCLSVCICVYVCVSERERERMKWNSERVVKSYSFFNFKIILFFMLFCVEWLKQELLTSKCEALSSNASTIKKKKIDKERFLKVKITCYTYRNVDIPRRLFFFILLCLCVPSNILLEMSFRIQL
jgi:hypothetical protein